MHITNSDLRAHDPEPLAQALRSLLFRERFGRQKAIVVPALQNPALYCPGAAKGFVS